MKKYIIIISAIAFLGIVTGISYLCHPDENLICRGEHQLFSLPVWLISASVFVSSFILLFLRAEIFKSWLIFSAWFLPLSILFIFLAPEYSNAFDIVPDKEITTMLMSAIFFLISLIIVAVKSWKLRGK